jgi:BASS family bile acid:Na+ symporter
LEAEEKIIEENEEGKMISKKEWEELKKKEKILKKDYLSGIAGLAIILIVALVIGENRNNFGSAHLILLLKLLLINIMGYLGGYIFPGLLKWPAEQKKTLSLEVGMQNAGLGTVLALKYFGTDSAIPPAIYTILCLITASFLVKLWRSIEK